MILTSSYRRRTCRGTALRTGTLRFSERAASQTGSEEKNNRAVVKQEAATTDFLKKKTALIKGCAKVQFKTLGSRQ